MLACIDLKLFNDSKDWEKVHAERLGDVDAEGLEEDYAE